MQFANIWRSIFLATAGVVAALTLSEVPVRAQERLEGEAERRNEIAAVVAGTWEHEDETFFTLGVEYERRLTSRLGVIAAFEHLFDADRWVVVAPIVFHVGHGLKFYGGPGFERSEAEHEEIGETHLLLRGGLGYTLEFAERFSVGPSLSFDFVREHDEWQRAIVFGVGFGVTF